jgi:hypothetical protein
MFQEKMLTLTVNSHLLSMQACKPLDYPDSCTGHLKGSSKEILTCSGT